LPARRQSAPIAISAKSTTQAGDRSFAVQSFVPKENSGGKAFTNSRRESLAPPNPVSGVPTMAAQARRSRLPYSEAISFDMPVPVIQSKELFEDENPTLKTVDEKSERNPSSAISSILQSGRISLLVIIMR